MDLNLLKIMTYALRLNMVLLITVTFGSFGVTSVQKSFAANVKGLSVIEGDLIHASDLFDGVSKNEDKVIGAAPLPGRDMVLNARTLLRIAVALDLPWRPQSGLEKVVVRRAATIIDENIIADAITDRLNSKGIEGEFNLIFSDSSPVISLPQSENANVHINSFEYDPSNNLFTAELVAPSMDKPLKRLLVNGKVERVIEIPVLNRSIQAGELIQARDVNWIKLPSYKIQHDYILDGEKLVGMTPRRLQIAGEPLKKNEVIEPLIIKRGENVIISYQAGPIELVSEGKAMESGARGDLIRVVNFSSNRSLNATIKDNGIVVVN